MGVAAVGPHADHGFNQSRDDEDSNEDSKMVVALKVTMTLAF